MGNRVEVYGSSWSGYTEQLSGYLGTVFSANFQLRYPNLKKVEDSK